MFNAYLRQLVWVHDIVMLRFRYYPMHAFPHRTIRWCSDEKNTFTAVSGLVLIISKPERLSGSVFEDEPSRPICDPKFHQSLFWPYIILQILPRPEPSCSFIAFSNDQQNAGSSLLHATISYVVLLFVRIWRVHQILDRIYCSVRVFKRQILDWLGVGHPDRERSIEAAFFSGEKESQ